MIEEQAQARSDGTRPAADVLDREVRVHVFATAAETGRVPQAAQIASALGKAHEDVVASLRRLAAAKVLILAPNSDNIWAANPFCAVPSGFRVESKGLTHWGICVWDALGIAAALHADAVLTAFCGDCSEPMRLEVRDSALVHGEGVIHFAVPAHRWWDNIGFT